MLNNILDKSGKELREKSGRPGSPGCQHTPWGRRQDRSLKRLDIQESLRRVMEQQPFSGLLLSVLLPG